MRIEWFQPAMQDMAALRDYIASDSPARSLLFIQRLSGMSKTSTPSRNWVEKCPKPMRLTFVNSCSRDIASSTASLRIESIF